MKRRIILAFILVLGVTGCTAKTESKPAENTAVTAESELEDTGAVVSETDPASETEPVSEPDPVSETDPASETEPASETDPASGTEPESETDPASETKPGVEAAAQTLEAAVADMILKQNIDRYSASYEVCGEGHIIMDTAQDGDSVTVYALTMYGSYQFQDGNLVKDSGSGVIPAVIQLHKEESGVWTLESYEEPMDGSLYTESVHSLFPDSLWERCITIQDEDREELEKQERAYAQAYLKTIGRDAAIGDYSDFPHTIPSDAGISTEVSNKIDEARKYADGPLAYAPFWFGTVEQVEDGVRYIYEHRYDAEKKEILFSKIVYDTGEIVEQVVFDSYTGERKN